MSKYFKFEYFKQNHTLTCMKFQKNLFYTMSITQIVCFVLDNITQTFNGLYEGGYNITFQDS